MGNPLRSTRPRAAAIVRLGWTGVNGGYGATPDPNTLSGRGENYRPRGLYGDGQKNPTQPKLAQGRDISEYAKGATSLPAAAIVHLGWAGVNWECECRR